MKYRYRTDEEIKDSGIDWIGKIPQKWRSTKVKHLFKLINEKSQEEKPIILSLTQGGIKIRDISKNDGQLAASYQGYTKVKKNYFVLNPMDLVSGYVDKSEFEGVISPAYTTFCKRENIILDEEFYKQYFQMHYHHKFLFPFGEGVSFEHRWTLKNETFLNIPIIEPDLVEQIKISKFLIQKNRDFNSIISKKEALIEKLEEAKKSLISEVVTGKVKVFKTENGYNVVQRSCEQMKDSGVECIGQIPISFLTSKMKYVSEVIDPQPDHRAPKLAENEGFPYVGIRDLNFDGTVNIETARKVEEDAIIKQEKAFSIDDGDIVFGKVGTLGNPKFIHPHTRIALSATLVLIKSKANIEKRYLRYVLDSKVIDRQMQYLAQGSTRPALGIQQIRKFDIPYPKLDEQIIIADCLDYKVELLENLCSKTYQEIKKLKEAKQSLINEAVTGKIEILD